MTDGPFPDRLSQLRARWEADSSSRIFLQLAEEYRHLGRVQEALAVLEKGLQEHPGYLSALVAKGRCLLELGDAPGARAVLERVVQQDATQMVANKLLVRAYLETGEAGRARERLDLYSLLNDSDPETEDLRRRVKDLERAAQAPPLPLPPPTSPDDFSSLPPLDLPAPPAFAPAVAAPAFTVTPEDPFADLIAPPTQAAQDDVFDLGFSAPAPARPPAPAAAPVAEESLFVFEDVAPAPAPALAESPEDPDDLFGLGTGTIRQRYLQSLSAEGIFDFGDSAPAAPAPAPIMPAVAPVPYEPAPFEPLQHPVGFEAFAPAPVEDLPVFEPPVYEARSFEPAPFEPEPFELDDAAAPPVFEPLPADLPTAGEEEAEETPALIPGESPFPEAHETFPEPVFAEPLPIPAAAFEPAVWAEAPPLEIEEAYTVEEVEEEAE
ncbi:MAG TPA: tetratricopeptide repeat protein, partial [Thermoanaerobaculia bacterium]|nr:tetratricopeptide repeat protein [Thermoanaerobaculia bacterium]